MDIASHDLNAAALPIPSEMRIFVFVASNRDPEMESIWLRCGGQTVFQTEKPEECGICIFRLGAGDLDLIRPFYRRGGKEANVFYFDSKKKNFVRIAEGWLDVYGEILPT